jgi:hypothetical protein
MRRSIIGGWRGLTRRSRFQPATLGYATAMTDGPREELTPDELEETNGEPLPDREEMAVVPDPFGGGATLPVEPPAES